MKAARACVDVLQAANFPCHMAFPATPDLRRLGRQELPKVQDVNSHI
jgi:hypothetical protein